MKKHAALLICCLILIIIHAIPALGDGSIEPPLSENGELKMADYDVIEVAAEDISVTDDIITSYINAMAEDLAETDENGDTVIPEITDRFIADNSLIYFGTQLDSMEAAKDFIRSILEDQNLKSAVISRLKDMAQVISYPEDTFLMAMQYAADEIAFYADEEGIDEDTLAVLSGYGSAKDYVSVQAEDNVKTAMIIDHIIDDLDIEWSEDARNEAVKEYMTSLGFDAYINVDDFIENSGETWLWLFTEFQYKSGLMFEALEDHIQIIE